MTSLNGPVLIAEALCSKQENMKQNASIVEQPMKRTVILPSKQQALIFWLRALDMDYAEIARHLGLSVVQVRGLHTQAQKLATAQGLAYKHTPPPEAPKVGSGMSLLKELALEAGLNAR